MLISPQWDCMCPCTRDCVCPEESREGAGRAGRADQAQRGEWFPRGAASLARLPPASSQAWPFASSPGPPWPRPCLSADCRIEPVHFHGVLASVPYSPPSALPAPSWACFRLPQPPPGLQASQHTLAFPWPLSLSSPSPHCSWCSSSRTASCLG